MDSGAVAVVLFLATQTGAFLWWASRMNERANNDHDVIHNDRTGLRVRVHDHAGKLLELRGDVDDAREDLKEIKADVKTLLRNGHGSRVA